MIQMTSGMDQKYLQDLDTSFKKSEDAQVKAGFQKSYKILRTLDDSGTWNLLILGNTPASRRWKPTSKRPMPQPAVGRHRPDADAGLEDRSKYRSGRRHEVRSRIDSEISTTKIAPPHLHFS